MARAASTRRRPLGEVSVQQRAVETAPSKRTAAGVSVAAAESRAAKVRSLTEELEAQVESRCAKLMEVAEDAVVALRAEYRVQLMKLPKKVRSMPLAEFRKEFGESIDAAMLSDIDRRIAAATAAGSGQQASGSGKKRKADASADSECEPADKVPCTPSAQGAKGAAPGTVSRMPRQGEELVSANGSPLGVFLEGGVTPAVGMKTMGGMETCAKTMVKARVGTVARTRRNRRGRPEPIMEVEEEPAITLRTDDGVEIDLANADGVDGLGEGLKAAALEKLMGLQNTVAALMAKLGK